MKLIFNTSFRTNRWDSLIRWVKDRISKIKATKKIAREKNLVSWNLPLLNSFVSIMVGAMLLSLATHVFLNELEESFSYPPWWFDWAWSMAPALPVVYGIIGILLFMDKLIILFIHYERLLQKTMARCLEKLDYYLWKKTGKDAPVTTALWKMASKFSNMTSRRRKLVITVAIILLAIVQVLRFFALL